MTHTPLALGSPWRKHEALLERYRKFKTGGGGATDEGCPLPRGWRLFTFLPDGRCAARLRESVRPSFAKRRRPSVRPSVRPSAISRRGGPHARSYTWSTASVNANGSEEVKEGKKQEASE